MIGEVPTVGVGDPAFEGDPEDGDPHLGGQAGGRLSDAAPAQYACHGRGEYRELDQLAFPQLRVGGDNGLPLPRAVAALPKQRAGGFLATIVGIARATGVSGYMGDGTNRWPAVHRLDAAHLFRLALATAPGGSTLHAVADEGVPIRAVADVLGRHLDVPVVSISAEDAGEHFSWLAGLLGLDIPASSTLTRQLLG